MKKFRWSKVYESQEEELVDLLASRGLKSDRYVLEEFTETDAMTIDRDTTFWCGEGSASLLSEGQSLAFQPGDAVTVAEGATVTLRAGMSGCAWYQT